MFTAVQVCWEEVKLKLRTGSLRTMFGTFFGSAWILVILIYESHGKNEILWKVGPAWPVSFQSEILF